MLTSERLVPLWAEARVHVDALEASDHDWWRWRKALSALVAALQEAEDLAATVEPRLGRRTWADRPAGPPGAPLTGTGQRPPIPTQAPVQPDEGLTRLTSGPTAPSDRRHPAPRR